MGQDELKDTTASLTGVALDDWDEHWTRFGAAAEIGPTPKYRRRIILQQLKVAAQDRTVRLLEIGSGTGEFAEEFRTRYPLCAYLGLELSATGVRLSRDRVPAARFLQRNLLQPANSNEGLDFGATHAICSEVLEHLEKPDVLLKNSCSYMTPGCRLIVTVPGGPMNAFFRHIGHRRHYSPDELRGVLMKAGFHVEETYGAGFPFLNLLRLFITWRGEKFIADVSGPPSVFIRLGGVAWDALFRLNVMRWGWQTIAVARYSGDVLSVEHPQYEREG